jgi:hypothetical protein
MGRGVVDIEEDGVELLDIRIVAFAERESEKVAEDITTARVVVESLAEWDEFLFMPFDHGLEVIDDAERAHRILLQSGAGGVAQAEASNDDVELFAGEGFFSGRETEIGELLFHHGEEGGHEEGIAEDDLIDLLVLQREDGAFSQDKVSERGLLVVDFFKSRDLRHAGGLEGKREPGEV